jgi:hypothetical protein
VQSGAIAPAVEREPAAISGEVPKAARNAVARARADLARRLGVEENTIEIVTVEPRLKQSGASDIPAQTNGWTIGLASGSTRYRYQVDAQGKLRRLR